MGARSTKAVNEQVVEDLDKKAPYKYKKYTWHIGIDPGGKSGAIAFLAEELFPDVVLIDMPFVMEGAAKNQHAFVDSCSLAKVIKSITGPHDIATYTVERVHAMPTDGRSSAFNFGRNFGHIMSVVELYALYRPLPLITYVTPAVWKKEMLGVVGSLRDKADKKMLSLNKARDTFSGYFVDSYGKLNLKKSHNRAEAALLAMYGMINYGKKSDKSR